MMRSTLIGLLAVNVAGDCYMHRPRGSNNRLNEKSANRNNGNRLFDSQNNNRGGYNVGDIGNTAYDPDETQNQQGSPFQGELNKDQYSLLYHAGSEMEVEWTSQHGCGGTEQNNPHKLNCNMVMQYTCNTNAAVQTDYALMVELKDGRNTNTPDTANNFGEVTSGSQRTDNDGNGRGRHESEGAYYECERRARNKGLFTADQNLKGNSQKYTRQNPNGNRRGLECPEERDYYPYWNPSPWIDVHYCGNDETACAAITAESQNVVEKFKCTYGGTDDGDRQKAFNALTKEDCEALKDPDGENIPEVAWTGFTHNVDKPTCGVCGWSRVNHLGNGVDGKPNRYTWTLPSMQKLGKYTDTKSGSLAKCVLRLRYNISTDDYDPLLTDASYNEDKQAGVVSPVEQNPTVDIGANLQGLKLAINTNQFGRTFQDRSHTFYVNNAPAEMAGRKVVNLGVRGKRGNIVQTFPSVEYDFIPNELSVAANTEWLHLQWTGSNTHNNGNPAGDGQAGDAGEGTGGTDRHNLIPIADRSLNYPIPFDKDVHDDVNLLKNIECYTYSDQGSPYMLRKTLGSKMSAEDCAVYLASAGYYSGVDDAKAKADLNVLLNNAPASLVNGVYLKATKPGTYHYMCTRNNNFSNRSQKGTLKVT